MTLTSTLFDMIPYLWHPTAQHEWCRRNECWKCRRWKNSKFDLHMNGRFQLVAPEEEEQRLSKCADSWWSCNGMMPRYKKQKKIWRPINVKTTLTRVDRSLTTLELIMSSSSLFSMSSSYTAWSFRYVCSRWAVREVCLRMTFFSWLQDLCDSICSRFIP